MPQRVVGSVLLDVVEALSVDVKNPTRLCLYSLCNNGILLLPCMMMCYIVSVLCLMCVWCPCKAINNNVSVQYNGGLLPGIILLTQ